MQALSRKRPGRTQHPALCAWSSPVGLLTARITRHGILSLCFPEFRPENLQGKVDSVRRMGLQDLPEESQASAAVERHATACEAWLLAYFAARPATALPAIDWSGHTEFQCAVWRALARLPFGKTTTYEKLANAVNRPGGARAVGGAMGRNPLVLLVPCHRVLAAGGRLGGFSSGLPLKEFLLRHEGSGEAERL